MKIILVTGGAGFIGSHFIDHLLVHYPNYYIINLDSLTYAANPAFLKGYENHPRYRLIQGDICDSQLVNTLFEQFFIEGVIHFAAESHVDNSIKDPGRFIQTNICGTHTLLQAAKNRWMEGPHQSREGCGHCRFHHISTDEVYGSASEGISFREDDPYRPSSPYSSSKASSDLIVQSYFVTYGLNAVVTNCSNNYGPRQHGEKFIPTVIRKALAKEAIPVYGNGSNIRDWLYVKDHCSALDRVFHKASKGQRYNIGGNAEAKNIDIARMIARILDGICPREDGKSYAEQIAFVKDRPGHDHRYSVDITRIGQELGWRPHYPFEQGLTQTLRWYVDLLALEQDTSPVTVS